MRLAIMQPYFFPYLGYFDLIHSVDLFVIYDTVQYIRRGWINRNRVYRQDGRGWQYVTVPIRKSPQQTAIADIRLSTEVACSERILGQLMHYGKKAHRSAETIDFVRECLSVDETSLSRLNVHILLRCAQLLGLQFEYRFCSGLDIQLDPERGAEERILDLCEALEATEYVNLPGGVDLYDPQHFEARNLKLTFRHLPGFQYDTGPYDFIPNLSIIDVLMWNEPLAVKRFLDEHRGAQD